MERDIPPINHLGLNPASQKKAKTTCPMSYSLGSFLQELLRGLIILSLSIAIYTKIHKNNALLTHANIAIEINSDIDK